MNRTTFSICLWGLAVFSACDTGPREIAGEPLGGGTTEQIFPVPGAAAGAGVAGAEAPVGTGQLAVMRTVTALEALETERYTYVRVREGSGEFWIAVMKQPIEIGGSYLFSGGLSKQGFQSQELNRFFDQVLLVSEFRPAAVPQREPAAAAPAAGQQVASAPAPGEVVPEAGSVKLADLVADIARYEGKTVQVTGKCVKVNPMIMGRNWLHLQDGSGVDLTVTTVSLVNPGDIVTMEGTIALNRDFGAGYRYDYIMEAAIVKK